ncbi:MAG: NfeD family protein [Endomicrobium sp.]|jgi:membrane protein implicated in regulation of membrane protease activity|nr:NfeD family protein [Endomicrobium sp.]
MHIVWFLTAIILIIFEILVPSFFFFVCLAVGAIFAAIMAYFISLIWLELIIFAVVSILSLYFMIPVSWKMISKSKSVFSNVDALIGSEAVVSEKIAPSRIGFVKVLGEVWRASSDTEIEAGEIVKIKSVEGTTLIVKK